MSNKAIYLAIGLITGVAVSSWYARSPESQPNQGTRSDVQTESVEARFIEREDAIVEQLDSVRDEIESLRRGLALLSEASTEPVAPPLRLPPGAVESSSLGANNVELERARIRALAQKGLVEALTESGFPLARAQEIEGRIEQHRLAATQARYESARRGDSTARSDAEVLEQLDTDSMLRSELGDADYERYLEAVGRPTEVVVFDVFSGSAAEAAGMLALDRIVSYDDHRVFSIMEITAIAVNGDPGAPVIVDILRDEQPLQLVMPRGPLGVMGSSGSPIQVFPAEQE